MFNRLFDYLLNQRHNDRYQQGCRDREAGLLPQMPDSIYLDGYLSNRPGGLDDVIRYFSSLEDYLKWKHKSLRA